MKKKIIVSIIVIGLLLTTSIASVYAAHQQAQSTTVKVYIKADVYVDDNNTEGPWDGTYEHPYQFIQDGVDAAEEGDKVFVFSGTYTENVVVDKSIILKGEYKETTIIDGMGIDSPLHIKASPVNFSGFTVKNSPVAAFSAGIYVRDYSDVFLTKINISDCIVEDNDCGIRLEHVGGSHISNCIINSNHAHSVYLIYSENVMIDNCEIYDNGGYFGNGWYYPGGIQVSEGDTPDTFCKNIEISNCQIHNNIGPGITIHDNSQNVKIHHNIISENDWGLEISFYSFNIDIHHNFITKNNVVGIRIFGSNDVSVYNNVISENGNNEIFDAGIRISFCYSSVTVKNNIISSNKKYGLLIGYSSGNNIIENNFIENEKQAFFIYLSIDESNTWDRNYWDDQIIPGAPKPIFGLIYKNGIFIPWVEFDWHPAEEPYDINATQHYNIDYYLRTNDNPLLERFPYLKDFWLSL